MKSVLLLSSIFALLGFLEAAGPRAAVTVRRLDRQLNALTNKHNSRAAAPLYADDFALITSTGRCQRKADVLQEMASPATVLHCRETTDVQVRVLGSTAVLTGTLHQRGTHHGRPFDTRQLVSYTWERADGDWQLLSGHSSPAPSSPPRP